jgi:hypothetical protein
MNSNPQLDLHPDAESLNAFMEQALAEHERGQILAHLAGCGRCRQVVYLAQEAAAEMEPVVTAAALRSAARQKSWFRNWRFAWVPVGALAAIVGVSYVVHVRRVEVASEMAKATLSLPQNDAGVSRPPSPPAEIRAAPPIAAAAPRRTAPKAMKPQQPSVASKQLTLSATAPSGGGASEMANASRDEAIAPPGAPGAGYPAMDAAAEYKPAPALAVRQQEQERAAAAYQAQSLATEKRSEANSDKAAKREAIAGMLTPAAPMAHTDASPPHTGSYDAGGRLKKSGTFAVYTAKPTELPSGLPALSGAAAQRSMLAVDSAGGVYLSEGSGIHWESVAKQWTGRAVSVRVQPRLDEYHGAAPLPAAVFEIVNDQGQVWVSTGGRIWKAK